MVVMGRIGAPFGVKGWVHVQSFTKPIDNILSYKTWYLKLKGQWQTLPISVLEIRAQGKGFVAFLQGYETRDAAVTLTHAEIGVPRTELPLLEQDEYYWTDLIGLTVVTKAGEILGKIDSLLETGSNDVLVVKGETQEYLIPYLPGETILEVNLGSRLVSVLWDPEF